jgi:ribosomal protein S18 acetylase RimI-like enzyme
MFKKIDNGLTPDIYFELRQKVTFQEYSFPDVEIALKNTLYSIVIFEDDRPIGIGRVVGDDRIVFFIKDVVVDPEFQKRSIGKLVMQSLLEYIGKKACSNAYVGLMATPNTEKFYRKFGFIQRPTDTLGHGMVKFVNTDMGSF